MSDSPLVSVVIPTYNAASYIVQAVQSALNQTYPNIEVVIVDDGSTDNTSEVIARAFNEDSRVRYLRQPNAGPSAARNRGVHEARGEFVHFLDADEWLLPTKTEKSYDLFRQQPEIAVVYGHGIAVQPDGVTIIPLEQPPLPSGWVFCEWLIGTMSGGTHGVTSSFMVRRAALIEVGGFHEAPRPAEDWDLWMRLASKYPFAALDEKLVYYRRIATGLHANRLNMALGRLQGYRAARDHAGREKCLDDAAYNRLLADRWQVVAVRYWEARQRQRARQAFEEAVKLDIDRKRTLLRRLYALMSYVLPVTSITTLTAISRRFKR